MNPSDRSHADIAARKYSSVVVTVTLLAMMWSIARWFHCRSCSQSVLDHALPATALPGCRRRWPSLREPTVVDDTSIDPTTVPIITAKVIMISTCWRLAFLCPSGFNSALNGGEKTHFANFLSPQQRSVSPTFWRTIFVKFQHKTWIDVIKTFGTEFQNDSGSGHFPTKNSFWVFMCTLAAHALQRWPLGLRRIWITLYYSWRAKNVCTSVAFLYDLPFPRHRVANSPVISESSRHVATFLLPIQRQFVTDKVCILYLIAWWVR